MVPVTDEHVLSNPTADRVKKVASLASRAGRRKQGLFLAEGPQPVREALALWLRRWEEEPRGEKEETQGLPRLDALYFDPAALSRHTEVEALLDRVRGVLFDPEQDLPREARIFLREATPEVLRAMGDAETSQGIIAVCTIPQQAEELPQLRLGAALLGVQDPGNTGTIIRAADAAGADAVVLTPGSSDPWAPKVVRSAAGSHFHLPIRPGADLDPFLDAARGQGAQILAADGGGEAALPALEQPQNPTVWLFGNEAHGLSEEEKAAADQRVTIPLYGRAESLNVATAAAVCLYHSATAQNSGAAQNSGTAQHAEQ